MNGSDGCWSSLTNNRQTYFYTEKRSMHVSWVHVYILKYISVMSLSANTWSPTQCNVQLERSQVLPEGVFPTTNHIGSKLWCRRLSCFDGKGVPGIKCIDICSPQNYLVSKIGGHNEAHMNSDSTKISSLQKITACAFYGLFPTVCSFVLPHTQFWSGRY